MSDTQVMRLYNVKIFELLVIRPIYIEGHALREAALRPHLIGTVIRKCIVECFSPSSYLMWKI